MRLSRKQIRITLMVFGLLALSPLLLLLHPRARAAMRLTPGFLSLEADARVFYEPGAEAYAESIAEALPAVIARVEECQTRPFRSDFRVYVCASHESFARHIALPVRIPVRGTAFLWDIWISPKAFAFHGKDTHRQSLAHELSHLHLGQHLGWLRRVRYVPGWFTEGLADWVADTGGEIVSREEATEGFLTGRHLVPDASGRLPLPRMPTDYGVPAPMFHMQSRMFIEYLRATDESSFEDLVAAVVGGVRFDVAFEEHRGDSLDNVWREFIDSMRTTHLQP